MRLIYYVGFFLLTYSAFRAELPESSQSEYRASMQFWICRIDINFFHPGSGRHGGPRRFRTGACGACEAWGRRVASLELRPP